MRVLFLIVLVSFLMRTSFSECPTIQLHPEFDKVAFSGTWYEQLRAKTVWFYKQDCTENNYLLRSDGSMLFIMSQFNLHRGQLDVFTAKATNEGAQFHVRFFDFGPAGDFRVVATDYTNFLVLFGCRNFFKIRTIKYSWVLTRMPNPTQELLNEAFEKLKAVLPGATLDDYRRTTHNNLCQYPSSGLRPLSPEL